MRPAISTFVVRIDISARAGMTSDLNMGHDSVATKINGKTPRETGSGSLSPIALQSVALVQPDEHFLLCAINHSAIHRKHSLPRGSVQHLPRLVDTI